MMNRIASFTSVSRSAAESSPESFQHQRPMETITELPYCIGERVQVMSVKSDDGLICVGQVFAFDAAQCAAELSSHQRWLTDDESCLNLRVVPIVHTLSSETCAEFCD